MDGASDDQAAADRVMKRCRMLRDVLLIGVAVWYLQDQAALLKLAWFEPADAADWFFYWGLDLRSFWCGAKAVFEHGRSPYDREYLQTLLPGKFVFPFLYPPPALLMFRPLAYMTLPQAIAAAAAVNQACTLFLAWFIPTRILRLSWRRQPTSFAVAVVVVCIGSPTYYNMLLGQVNILTAAALLGCWVFLRRDRDAPAGACLALATLLKTTPLLAIPFLIAAGKSRACLWSAAFLGAATVAAQLILPAGMWEAWRTEATPLRPFRSPIGTVFSPVMYDNQSLSGVVLRLCGASTTELVEPALPARLAALGACGVLAAASIFAVRRRFKTDPLHAVDWAMLLFSLTLFLASPLSWLAHLVFVYGAALVMLRIAAESRGRTGWRIVAAAGTLAIPFSPAVITAFPAVLAVWAVAMAFALFDPRSFGELLHPSDEPSASAAPPSLAAEPSAPAN